ncbi:MAG: hypothetical protein CVV47_07870 [Spirochaetae bacterium HGW-Spirochaetae-3]|jgi:murein DD-endopeptidase MepM/ murein hydrolase activator NlpD|nr:MAG: hypothetical protein CVV47_07870 [Spirochaetae bacterium HGW-Spirochaetae-3]
MKALPHMFLIIALGAVPAFSESPVLLPPSGLRRGEPAFAALALTEPGGRARDYTLSIRYADGSDGPRSIGFSAPAAGRDVRSEGPSAASTYPRVVLFLAAAPITAPLGEASMVVFGPGGEAVAGARLIVADRVFERQDLPLDQALTSLRVDPDPLKTEQALRYQAVLASADPSAAFLDSGFVKPVASERRTSLFGLRRRYLYVDGGVDVTTHNGIDYGSPTGTPVVAAGAGRVVMAEARIVTGNTVVIEHLPGAYTIYMHLDTMAARVGTVLARGDPVGTVGMTGLATGPHLHWEFRVMGTACDPEVLVGLDKMPDIHRIVSAIEGG